MRRIAAKETRKRNRVKLGYGKTWTNNGLWYWDEEKGVLKDEKGEQREEGKKEEVKGEK